MAFLISNGKIIGEDELASHIFLAKTSFSFSQKVWYGYGGIPLFSENMEQIQKQVNALKLPFPKGFENRNELHRLTKRMLNKNNYYRSGHLNIRLFWNEMNVSSLITANTFSTFEFPFTENGILAQFGQHKKDSQNSFNRYPFYNKIFWQAALAQTDRSPHQQVIFLNEKNFICECANANIYMVKNNELITPALSTGCYEDVLRSRILETAKQYELLVLESETVKTEDIFEMDEVFCVSESNGFQWILGIDNRRYLHQYSRLIHKNLCARLADTV